MVQFVKQGTNISQPIGRYNDMTFNKQKPTYFFTCLIILSLLTACGGYSQPTAVNRSAGGEAVNDKNRSASSAAVAEILLGNL